MRKALAGAWHWVNLPRDARIAHLSGFFNGLHDDPGIEAATTAAVAWICRAQDCSASQDGGIARHFSLVSGWGTSYPETTGYAVPTLLELARRLRDDSLKARVQRMLDWLVSIQFPDGSFHGGTIGDRPVVPVAFNSGQILIGLAAGVREFGQAYREPMRRAADWLVQAQDADGCWRKYSSPFAMAGERAYDAHVAWGLFEAASAEGQGASRYADAAMRNVRWCLTQQQANGWFRRCCLSDPSQPLTHTLGYTLRGLIEAHRFSADSALLETARRTADGILCALRPDGFLPGRLNEQWKATVRWSCLTGTVQVAYCWLYLYRATGDARYKDAAFSANAFVRRTIALDGPPGIHGGVQGSFPIYGKYGAYEYLNWASNFFLASNLLEAEIREGGDRGEQLPSRAYPLRRAMRAGVGSGS